MTTLEQRLQKLEDESAIRDLVAKFADAATRNDMALLATVWKVNAVFTIEEPLKNVRNGVDEIVGLVSQLRGNKEFFVQYAHSGVIELNADRATARWIMRETGKGGEKYYHVAGMFFDSLEKINGKWLFAERTWRFAYIDFSCFTGNGHALPASV